MRRALITGANSEIGQAITNKLYDEGWQLILCEQEKEYSNLIHMNKGKNDITFFQLNLEEDRSLNEMTEYIEKQVERIDLLVNVAGINILKRFMDWEKDELDNILKINAVSTLILTQSVAQKMITQKAGNIIFLGSQHGVVANIERVPYSLSKAMLIQMTKSLALELAPFNIRVNCVSPTYVLTNTNSSILTSALFKIEALSEIPLGRYATPKDVAEGVYFLGTENSRMITGHNLIIDGGWTIK